eukprot:1330692-Pleurochrysis_carterae.AAC.1
MEQQQPTKQLSMRACTPNPVRAPANLSMLNISVDAVPTGLQLTFKAFWERGREIPPFIVENKFAVDFLKAVVDSPVGTGIKHNVSIVSEAVAVQVYRLLYSQH